MSNQENGVKEVVKEFTEADNAIETVFLLPANIFLNLFHL